MIKVGLKEKLFIITVTQHWNIGRMGKTKIIWAVLRHVL